ncbi:ParB/RepB/Spo0J family partition protein [Ruminococcus sp. YE282]|uniref:ParB/RepB/Spo0J family partition protein n=1 Tax=Ruminococcus sp. YE282 TaxID=3158780 RepID=UPI000889902F|nr:ParB/RepB/Spo0J family partition protein [Ruminococcus bromii]SCY77951.1 ParB/RepB/Spo0J family partition protein [Ruminococcus bromii]
MSKFNIPVQNIPSVETAYANVFGKDTDNQIFDIPNEKIVENNNQNFKIHDDTIEQLAEEIARDGQLSPCIVTPITDGKYELIDGRHRRRAVILAGLPTTKCIIKHDLDDTAKATIRLTTNLIRNNNYLPSELAFAYKELAELRNNDMSKISSETNQSKKKIYRYIRLTKLIKPLLDRVDNGNIPIIAAVELSYLTQEQQNRLFSFLLNHSECKITTQLAREIKESPDNLYEIFFAEDDEENFETDVDNLSTKETDTQRQVDNLSTNESEGIQLSSGCYEYLSSDERSIIAEFIIEKTKADYYILRYAYNSQEIIKLFDDYHKSYSSGVSRSFTYEWHCRSASKALKLVFGGKTYLIPYKVVEEITRLYIREYSIDKIKTIIGDKK